MSDLGVHQFELTDGRGVSHSYIVTEHPAGEGTTLMFALLGLGAPTVLGLAGAALKSEDLLRAVVQALGPDAPGLGTSGLGALVAELDLGTVGAELGRALATEQMPGLTRKILSRTHRDGKPLSTHYDVAYQANYAELLQAVWKVCQINRFFPLPSTSANSSIGAATATPRRSALDA